jgi:hypothetical protein
MRKLVTIAVVLGILGLSGLATAQESTDGVIDGQVINGTAGGGNVSGLDVTLLLFIDDTMGETKTAVTDDQGRFRFSDLAIGPSYGYLVLAHYMGVDYYGAVIFGADETSTFVEVPVCETTDSDETIRIVQAHTIIVIEDESLYVSEYFLFSNDGDRTYVGSEENAAGGRKGTLVFTLPQGATDFEAPQEMIQDCIFLGNSTFADTLPFPPGDMELIYSYRLPMSGSDVFTIPLKVNYPTDSFSLMMQGEAVEVTSDRLTLTEPVEDETGEWFIHLKGENLTSGSTLDIHVSRLSGGIDAANIVLWVVVAVLALCIVLSIYKRKRAVSVLPMVLSFEGDIELQKQRLMQEIAQLDDEFEQGAIDENIFRQRRLEKKSLLLEMIRRGKEKGKSSG